jgi:hypothetical protein
VVVVGVAASIGVAAEEAPIELPGGNALSSVDFERHVASLFGRLGCNSAACHGSYQGKGGLRLSLFGQSTEKDYLALSGAPGDVRIDRDAPDASLFLLKPTGREEHGGGARFREGSWEHQVFRRWILQGARHVPGSGDVVDLRIVPEQLPLMSVGVSHPLHVMARFADGTQEDVSPFCEFRSRDDAVVSCTGSGLIGVQASGETAIIAAYRGQFASLSVLVPYANAPELPAPPAAANFIDEEVHGKLAQLGLAISPTASDWEFLRRSSLDVLGTLPTPDQIREFQTNADPAKRDRWIDRLLAHPRRAALWATRLCDITACNVDTMESPPELKSKRAWMWHDWFRSRIAENVPYDEIVRGVLCATSRGERPIEAWIDQEAELLGKARAGFAFDYAHHGDLDLFWRRTGANGPLPVEDLAELTASAFLGIRLHCARCHQHPFDHWSQRDFAGYAGIFARVEFGASTELRTATNARLEERRVARREGRELPEVPRLQEVFLSEQPRSLSDAATVGPVVPRAPGGPLLEGAADPRVGLFRWLTEPDNPYFARTFVNRLWARYFGRGLVEPVDTFSPANPPTHPRLLDRLARAFCDSGYDIREMERLILSSQTYQRSAAARGNNAADRHNFARAAVRPLLAETLVDALNAALETSDDFGPDVPAGSQAIDLAPNRFSTESVNELFRVLGRGDRKSLCECDRPPGPSLRQPVFLMSDERILEKVRAGRLASLLRENRESAEIIDELYLATLSRFPDEGEREFLSEQVSRAEHRDAALADIVWALINTREFVTNH